jgi:hypothetical protein
VELLLSAFNDCSGASSLSEFFLSLPLARRIGAEAQHLRFSRQLRTGAV